MNAKPGAEGVLAIAGPVELGATPARISLTPTAGAGGNLASQLAALGPGRHLYLVLRDLRATEQPGVLYHLYLDLPPLPLGGTPAEDDPRHVGSLNFYNATPVSNPGFFQSYDISDAMRGLARRKMLSDATTVTILPFGTPAEGARPVIGWIELAVQ
jgi:hypothetical protein